MLEYYLPGLDVSALSDEEFIQKAGYLLRIRQMEKVNKVSHELNNLIPGE